VDLFAAMNGRRSVRRFLPDAVPREALSRMVEAALEAPTAGNAQNFRFLVLTDRVLVRRMKAVVDSVLAASAGRPDPGEAPTPHNLFAFAPVTVCVLSTPYESATDAEMKIRDPERFRLRRERVNPGLQGVAAAVTQFLLAAHALGYGACWMTGPLAAKGELEEELGVRPPEELVALVALGRPADAGKKPPRKSVESVTEFW
jgi:nitroreductase